MAAASSRRPNFILFINDQHRVDYLGCYGHPVVKTPNIDSIAARGTAFDQFYVASPVCMPNRVEPDDRADAVGAWRALKRHSAVARCRDLRRPAARGRLRHGAGWQEPSAELHRPSAVLPSRKAPEGCTTPPPELAQAFRTILVEPAYQKEVPPYWEAPDAAVVRRRSTASIMSNWSPAMAMTLAATIKRWLRAKAPGCGKAARSEERLPHDYACPQAYRTAIPEELYSTAYIGERAVRVSRQWSAQSDSRSS